ncbi:hypothetical protein KFK09_016888 [Dendrobium nobile]|uniref:Dof zinc finger protein n=1 Tax=Dendrobium nobile TaxID=94219 RepID=A0A8T3AZJ0_DENNO|nr:hypothetical protein KFK09_016888 [Dendrobium nobile]
MEITNGHQYQTMISYPLNEVAPVLSCLKAAASSPYHLHQEINPSPQFQSQSESQQALKCPRCDSLNTKFCYYNNYSLSQPRYFCKSCRRYWTKGGSLRNIPIGGGCRKNKKPASSSTSPSSSSKKIPLTQVNPNSNLDLGHGFLDVLRSGFVGSANTTTTAIGGIQSHCYGFGGDNGVTLPFDGGLISVSDSTTAAANASAGASTVRHENCWSGFFNGFSNEIHDGHF